MPSAQEDRKFYLRVPDLEFVQGGPIKIGNIITDMFLPQDPIAFLDPLPNIIQGAGAGEGNRERENHASANTSFSAKLYEAFGGRAEAKGSRSMRTVYDYDEIESWYLDKNPTAADAKALRKKDEEVDGALNNGPVYAVTGLKIAKGLKYSNRRTFEIQGGLSGGGRINEHAALEGRADGARGGENTESYKVIGDCILAYRLHIIKVQGLRWRGEPTVQARTYDPGDGGFMNRDNQAQEVELETEEVSRQDVKYFADEEEYGGVREVDIEDEEEAWSMLFIEG